jgi:GST-like protein
MTQQPVLTFYTADTPNGQKISIFLEEAGLPYKQINLNLSAGDQRTPAYLEINPNGKIPAIVNHSTGVTVFESGAILTLSVVGLRTLLAFQPSGSDSGSAMAPLSDWRYWAYVGSALVVSSCL